MKINTLKLQLFVQNSITTKNLSCQKLTAEDFLNWKKFINRELLLHKNLLETSKKKNGTKKKPTVEEYCRLLTDLSDTVNTYLFRMRGLWQRSPDAKQIKTHYLWTCEQFENLLTFVFFLHPCLNKAVKATNYSLPSFIVPLKHQYAALLLHMQQLPIDPALSEIVLAAIYQQMSAKSSLRSGLSYISALIEHLLTSHPSNTEEMLDLMNLCNFNYPEYFLYVVNHWQRRLLGVEGLHEQREFLLFEQSRIKMIKIQKGPLSTKDDAGIINDLSLFLTEKQDYLTKLIDFRREAISDAEKAKSGARFLINLPVPQFGLFIRMQVEKGLLAKENIGELFSFFATHFYTPYTSQISAESLQKKSSDVEFSTAQKMKGQLIGMLNWLNSNYNLSNYN